MVFVMEISSQVQNDVIVRRLVLSDIYILADRLSVEEEAWKGADDSAGLMVKCIAAKLPESWRMLLCKVCKTVQLYFFLALHH